MKENTKKVIKLLVAAVFLVIFFIFWKYSGLIQNGRIRHINIIEIRHVLNSSGKWSEILFIVIYALKPVVFIIPASLLSIAGGMLYGPFWGTVYTMVGAFLSATTAFFIAKILGRDTVEKLLKKKARIESFDDKIEKNGFKIMLLMRLAFVFPYDALSYAAGISKMRYSHFILGTMLGVLPEMITYNIFGGNINRPFNKETITAVSIVIILALTSLLVKTKNENKIDK